MAKEVKVSFTRTWRIKMSFSHNIVDVIFILGIAMCEDVRYFVLTTPVLSYSRTVQKLD